LTDEDIRKVGQLQSLLGNSWMEAMRAMRINIFIAAQLKASVTSMSDVKIGMYLFLVFWDRQACFQLMMKCSMSFAVFAAAQQLRSRSCVSPSPDPDILQCDGCKAGCDPAFYCDGECRRLDWKRHKN
jgi:hypothetical protein